MRPESRAVAVLAALLLALVPSGPPAALAEARPAADKCPAGPDGRVTITLAAQGGQCVVAGDVPPACVDRGGKLTWSLVNKDCALDQAKTAIEISQPRPKGGQKPFAFAECTPSRKGWKKGGTESIACRVPKDAEPGLFKYDVSGQIKKLDPDIEVRKGG